MSILSWIFGNPTSHPGVYRIRNTITGREYIGGTSRPIRTRWRQHKNNLKCNRHMNRLLQQDWNTYGADAFEFSVIEVINNGYDKVFEKERYWQDQGFSLETRYNPRNENGRQETYFAQANRARQYQIALPDRFSDVDDLLDYAKSHRMTGDELSNILSRIYSDGDRVYTDEKIKKLLSRA